MPPDPAAVLPCSMKRTVTAAAFINFKTAQDVQQFSSKFSRCTFIAEDGTHVPCQVQYAPCQKTPRSRVRRDPREGLLHKGGACCLARFPPGVAAGPCSTS